MELLQSALHDRHAALGAKFAEFGGWQMPLEYADASAGRASGVLGEHAAVRDAVGLFDVSHLGKATVRGPGAADFVNSCLTNDLGRIAPGKAQYTLCCDESGGTVDDLIVYLRGDSDVLLVPNAANTAEVVDRLAAQAPEGIEVVNRHSDFAVLALQGPASDDVLQALDVRVDQEYMSFVEGTVAGVAATVCRTGYTGERGYELIVADEDAGTVWDAVLTAGAEFGIAPCGLGARDTLRTEMGYPLHGHELSDQISPVMARAVWAVGWDKDTFWGKEALTAQRAAQQVPLLRGIVSNGRGIPRPAMAVRSVGPDGEPGEVVGQVTSGTFSPTLRQGIGLALLDRSVTFGDQVVVEVRKRNEPFTVVKPPFVDNTTA